MYESECCINLYTKILRLGNLFPHFRCHILCLILVTNLSTNKDLPLILVYSLTIKATNIYLIRKELFRSFCWFCWNPCRNSGDTFSYLLTGAQHISQPLGHYLLKYGLILLNMRTKWWIMKEKHPSLLSSSFVTYIFCKCHMGSFPIILFIKAVICWRR